MFTIIHEFTIASSCGAEISWLQAGGTDQDFAKNVSLNKDSFRTIFTGRSSRYRLSATPYPWGTNRRKTSLLGYGCGSFADGYVGSVAALREPLDNAKNRLEHSFRTGKYERQIGQEDTSLTPSVYQRNCKL